MAKKKKREKQPNLRSLIVTLIADEGLRKLSGMPKILKASYKTLNTEALRLRKLDVPVIGCAGNKKTIYPAGEGDAEKCQVLRLS